MGERNCGVDANARPNLEVAANSAVPSEAALELVDMAATGSTAELMGDGHRLDDSHSLPENKEHEGGRSCGCCSKCNGSVCDLTSRLYQKNKRLLKNVLLFCLNVVFIGYFAWALAYFRTETCYEGSCDMDWCSGVGMLIIIFVIGYTVAIYYPLKRILKKHFRKYFEGEHSPLIPCFTKQWQRRAVRWTVDIVPMVALLIFVFIDTKNDSNRLMSLAGLVVYVVLGFIFSRHPGKIDWHPVLWGLYLQFVFGLITLRWDVGRNIFKCIGDKVTTFLQYSYEGSIFVYGDFLVIEKAVFAFQVLSVIYFFSFMVSIFYHLGVMQWIVLKLGWLLQLSMGTTVCESVNAAASIFLGQSESPLLIKPYIKDLTKSEIHTIMASGFATVAGTVLAAYVSFGVQASHVITASVMSAPAALCYSKLFYPETEESKTSIKNIKVDKGEATGVLDAATQGAMTATNLVLGIIANIIAFVACVAFLDGLISWLGGLVGHPEVTFQFILSKVFIPFTYVMGVEAEQVEYVSKLIGIKTLVNEFVAYQELGEMLDQNLLTPRSEIIATYALCGFSNPSSVGIMIGALSALAPNRRAAITEVAFRALIAGSAVCFMTACIAGILVDENSYYLDSGTNSTIF
ncbi:solute carrier family 28 member 3-like [Schistocerca americana]|nr:solute carrier family 28 member 3-like [Schistocerca americana]